MQATPFLRVGKLPPGLCAERVGLEKPDPGGLLGQLRPISVLRFWISEGLTQA